MQLSSLYVESGCIFIIVFLVNNTFKTVQQSTEEKA